MEISDIGENISMIEGKNLSSNSKPFSQIGGPEK